MTKPFLTSQSFKEKKVQGPNFNMLFKEIFIARALNRVERKLRYIRYSANTRI